MFGSVLSGRHRLGSFGVFGLWLLVGVACSDPDRPAPYDTPPDPVDSTRTGPPGTTVTVAPNQPGSGPLDDAEEDDASDLDGSDLDAVGGSGGVGGSLGLGGTGGFGGSVGLGGAGGINNATDDDEADGLGGTGFGGFAGDAGAAGSSP